MMKKDPSVCPRDSMMVFLRTKNCSLISERLELQKDRELNIDNDDRQSITFLKYGICRDSNEWSLPRSFGEIKLFNKRLNYSVRIPTNRRSALMVNLPEDLNQWRLKDRSPEERKYVVYNHDLNALIKAPFGVVTAFPDDKNPVFNSSLSSQRLPRTSSCQLDLQSKTPNSPCLTINQSNTIETTSIGIKTANAT